MCLKKTTSKVGKMFVDLECEIVKITLTVTQIQACSPDPQALTIRNAHPCEHTHTEKHKHLYEPVAQSLTECADGSG